MRKKPDPVARVFGQRLRAARTNKGLSLHKLGLLLNPTHQRQSLSDYELGHTSPTITLVSQLATALGCSPFDLLKGIDSLTPPTNGG